MKTIAKLSLLVMFFVAFTAFTTIQDAQTFEGTFDGHEDYGYNFIGIDVDDEEYTMTFQEIDEKLLKNFNLQSEDLIGTKFSVTYTTTIEVEVDEDGYEDEIETNKIIALKKL